MQKRIEIERKGKRPTYTTKLASNTWSMKRNVTSAHLTALFSGSSFLLRHYQDQDIAKQPNTAAVILFSSGK